MDDAELPVGVVVGHYARPPEHEVVRPPAGAAVELVVHDGGQRGGVGLALHERAAGGVVVDHRQGQAVVPLLADVQGKRNGEDQCGGNQHRDERDVAALAAGRHGHDGYG